MDEKSLPGQVVASIKASHHCAATCSRRQFCIEAESGRASTLPELRTSSLNESINPLTACLDAQ